MNSSMKNRFTELQGMLDDPEFIRKEPGQVDLAIRELKRCEHEYGNTEQDIAEIQALCHRAFTSLIKSLVSFDEAVAKDYKPHCTVHYMHSTITELAKLLTVPETEYNASLEKIEQKRKAIHMPIIKERSKRILENAASLAARHIPLIEAETEQIWKRVQTGTFAGNIEGCLHSAEELWNYVCKWSNDTDSRNKVAETIRKLIDIVTPYLPQLEVYSDERQRPVSVTSEGGMAFNGAYIDINGIHEEISKLRSLTSQAA